MTIWSKKATKATAQDPVCGMRVDPEKPGASLAHMGKTYYFCSPTCKDEFSKEPARYLGDNAQSMGGMGHCH